MTGAEVQASYFSPLNFILYLLVVLVLLTLYLRWTWSKRCRTSVKVLVSKTDGSTETRYAPKSGNCVILKNPENGTARMWPINQVCVVEMLYPGDGFIPRFLQDKIKMVIVDENDWEPLLNRGSYTEMVASPDVVRRLRALAEQYEEAREDIESLATGLTTAPTRELVASPEVFGNLMMEKVTETVLTISSAMVDKLESLLKKAAGNATNPMVFYLGFGLVLIGIIFMGMKVLPMAGQIEHLQANLERLMTAQGIDIIEEQP